MEKCHIKVSEAFKNLSSDSADFLSETNHPDEERWLAPGYSVRHLALIACGVVSFQAEVLIPANDFHSTYVERQCAC